MKQVNSFIQMPSTAGGNFLTPLRYPGGKARLGPWLGQVIDANELKGGWYVEPYAGGAGAALYLLAHGFVEHIVINDIDPVIHAFWLAVTTHPDAFIDRIRNTDANLSTRVEMQNIIAQPKSHSTLDLGFAAFFLNRTSRSGILTGGVIGGKAQDGPYKLDTRYSRENLIGRVRLIGDLKRNITVLGLDALDLLNNCSPNFPEKRLVYLDPPYYVKGSQLYRNFYSHQDHEAIAQHVQRASYPVLVTYDDCDQIHALYQGIQSSTFSLHYSTHLARPKASEVLFYSNLKLPHPPALTRSIQPRAYAENCEMQHLGGQLCGGTSI